MNRRTFLTVTGAAGLAASLSGVKASAAAREGRLFLELQKYTLENEEQRKGFDTYMKEVGIPAMNKLGSRPIGVFYDPKSFSPVYVLVPHTSARNAVSMTSRLLADAEVSSKGASFLNAPKASMPYKEVECWLMRAFKGMPAIETPAKSPDRVFQLRIYESPSVQTGQKKIEMFNDAGELKIFREVGLNPVFFGETLYGAKIPNLTYMLGFESVEAMKAAWGKFGKHPEWQKLRKMEEYADSRVIRGITNIELRAADYSQI